MSNVRLFEVGGCVRDRLLGVESKDIDFSVEAPSFAAMREFLVAEGFQIFVENEEFLTIRARFPKGHKYSGLTADFVTCRSEADYTDGRRPDKVVMGTLWDDLCRRDFTVNAIAQDMDGNIIDPFGGRADLEAGLLRCVGRAQGRLTEDALRAIRAIRFSITKGFTMDANLVTALKSDWLPPLLVSVSTERKKDEMLKCFQFDTLATLDMLQRFPAIRDALFEDGRFWLKPTMEKR